MIISTYIILVACNSQMNVCFGGYCHEGWEVIVMKVIRRIFIIYCIVLSIVLLFKFDLSVNSIMEKINSVRLSREHGAWNCNLIPFRTISSQLSRFKTIPTIVIKNLFGNIAIFVPFSILLPMGYEAARKYHRVFLVGLVYILIIEFAQLICMLGSFDVDDIILNSIGVSCGYVIFKIISKVWQQRCLPKRHTNKDIL